MTCSSPTGATPSWCRVSEGSFDLDDYIDYLIEFLEAIGERTGQAAAHAGGLPAVGSGLCRDRAHERRQASGAAEDADDDGRADRHAQGADRGQHAGDRSGRTPGSSSNVIATVPMIYPGRRPEGLSGLPAARRLHDHEPWHPPHQPLGDVQASRRWRRRKRRCDPRLLRRISVGLRHDAPNSTSRRSTSCSSATCCPRASSSTAAGGSIRRRSSDTALLAIEGERDDISGIGQTKAALDLATKLPARRSNITWPRTSAITASSTAANGARRSRRWSRNSSPLTTDASFTELALFASPSPTIRLDSERRGR